MSAQSVTDAEPGVPVEEGPGHRLRAAREARKLGFSQVAAELHLGEEIIAALERDEYEGLSGPVFVQGYLRKYARLLGESEELIIQAYHQMAPEGQRHRPTSGAPLGSATQGSGSFFRIILLLVVIGAVAAVFWLRGDLKWPLVTPSMESAPPVDIPVEQEESPAIEPAPPVVEETPPEKRVQAPEALDMPILETVAEAAATTEEVIPVEPAEVMPEVEAVEEEVVATVAAAEAETPLPEPITEGILFEFSAASWVDIRDSSGKFKLLGNVPMGARRVLEGVPPYSVILGNSQAVKVSINGKPFDIEPFSRGNVARFSLDPEQVTAP
jgi:cytoskeleton protein RodZ